MGYDYTKLTGVIANGTSLSAAIGPLPAGFAPSMILLPAAWTAAGLTFQVSVDGGTTYQNYYDKAGEVAVASLAAASLTVTLDPNQWPTGVDYVKVRSGTSGTPVNQGADRTMTVLCRKILS